MSLEERKRAKCPEGVHKQKRSEESYGQKISEAKIGAKCLKGTHEQKYLEAR